MEESADDEDPDEPVRRASSGVSSRSSSNTSSSSSNSNSSSSSSNNSNSNRGRGGARGTSSIVRYRKHTLVYVKPWQGAHEQVFFAQLLEHIVEITEHGRKRRRGQNTQRRTRFACDKPSVRFFGVSPEREGDGVAYDHDEKSLKAVSITAIYGRIDPGTYTNAIVSSGDLLESFDIAQDEVDRLEGLFEEAVPVAEVNDSEAEEISEEEETEALSRERKRQKESERFPDVDESLVIEGSRSRAPHIGFLDEVRYSEVRGIHSSRHH